MSEVAYKLVTRADWDAARVAGAYAGSAVDRADGYIHMSTRAQLAATAAKHYAGQSGLMLVTVDLAALGDALRWEPSRGGDLFPHLYAPLPTGAALVARALSVDGEGVMQFEDGAVGWP